MAEAEAIQIWSGEPYNSNRQYPITASELVMHGEESMDKVIGDIKNRQQEIMKQLPKTDKRMDDMEYVIAEALMDLHRRIEAL